MAFRAARLNLAVMKKPTASRQPHPQESHPSALHVPSASRLVRAVADGPDAARAVVVRTAPPAKLEAATAGHFGTRHVVAAVTFFDGRVASRAWFRCGL